MRVDDSLLQLPSRQSSWSEKQLQKGVNQYGIWQTPYMRESRKARSKPFFLYDVPVQNRPTSTIVLPNEEHPSDAAAENRKPLLKEADHQKIIVAGYATAAKNVADFLSTLPEGLSSSQPHSLSAESVGPLQNGSRASVSALVSPSSSRSRSRFRPNILAASSPSRGRESGVEAMRDAVVLPELRTAGVDAADPDPSRSGSTAPFAPPPSVAPVPLVSPLPQQQQQQQTGPSSPPKRIGAGDVVVESEADRAAGTPKASYAQPRPASLGNAGADR